MRKKNKRYFVADFETTVYEGQAYTEVWASALVEIGSEEVKVEHSIQECFDTLFTLAKTDNLIVYFHNLKFDGAFILDYLMRVLKWDTASTQLDEFTWEFHDEKDMKNKTFKYCISDMGQWYTITIKVNNHIIEIRDSLKLLPMSVARIGKSFKTKHQKLDIEYEGYRYAGCEITPEEVEYIKNDVLVVKEALEIMFKQGHTELTIGSCCLKEYKQTWFKDDFKRYFPDLREITLDKELFGSENAERYVRNSYRGGWCYVVEGKENRVMRNGCTLDVNSLYPSMMSSESGNYYPVGNPTFWNGNEIPKEATQPLKYYFVRIRTRFRIKDGKLPFIQIKNNPLYPSNKCLTTSDYYDKNEKTYHRYIYDDINNKIVDTFVTLTMTMTDYELFKEHYDLIQPTILDGCYFDACIGIFDTYIEKYKKIKMDSKDGVREIAKLFLNNLYGKLASSDKSSFNYAYLKEDGSTGFRIVTEHDKDVVYIPCGSAITSYARNFTIRSAQANFYGKSRKGFIYADTDSIHCDLSPSKIKGVNISETEFCKWKLETCWDEGIFLRQKTYMEHVTHEGLEECEPYINMKCAGMPEKCKQLFLASMSQDYNKEDFNEEELEFLATPRTMKDFKVGLTIPSKLLPKRILGGIVLTPTTYEIRG